jgi:hypothetical protein
MPLVLSEPPKSPTPLSFKGMSVVDAVAKFGGWPPGSVRTFPSLSATELVASLQGALDGGAEAAIVGLPAEAPAEPIGPYLAALTPFIQKFQLRGARDILLLSNAGPAEAAPTIPLGREFAGTNTVLRGACVVLSRERLEQVIGAARFLEQRVGHPHSFEEIVTLLLKSGPAVATVPQPRARFWPVS